MNRFGLNLSMQLKRTRIAKSTMLWVHYNKIDQQHPVTSRASGIVRKHAQPGLYNRNCTKGIIPYICIELTCLAQFIGHTDLKEEQFDGSLASEHQS